MEKINNYFIENQNKGLIKTFFRMFLGLLATALAAYFTYSSGLYLKVSSGMSYAVLAIIEVVVVLVFSFMYKKLSPTMVTILFFAYAFINGITMAFIFAAFNLGTIANAFFTTALLFVGLALYGHFTKRDMTKLGSIFSVALIVGLIVSIINLFMNSSMITIILDWVMLFVFCGLTAHDMNQIKYMQNYVNCDDEKLYIYCAMDLYLDFINIFIRLLSIFARRERD